MTQTIRKSSLIARRYADSLLDLAEDSPGLEAIDTEIRDLLEVIDSSADLRKVLKDPRIKTSDKKAVLNDLAKRLKSNDIIIRFISVLADNDRLSSAGPIFEAVCEGVKTRRGIIDAHVKVSGKLKKSQEDNLKKSLIKTLGAEVRLHTEIDETLLGGMVLLVKSFMVDDSVKNKLERLERKMITGNKSGGSTRAAA